LFCPFCWSPVVEFEESDDEESVELVEDAAMSAYEGIVPAADETDGLEWLFW
jgi:hypothetical protein